MIRDDCFFVLGWVVELRRARGGGDYARSGLGLSEGWRGGCDER